MVNKRVLTVQQQWILVSIFAASTTLATLALVTASGAVLIDATTGGHDTEFANATWAWAALLLAVPVANVAARWSGIISFYAIVAALLPQVWLAVQYQINASAAGWAGPLDMLAFIWPAADFVCYGIGAAIGSALFERRPS